MMLEHLQRCHKRMISAVAARIAMEKLRLSALRASAVMRSPKELVHIRRMRLDSLYDRLKNSGRGCIDRERARLGSLSAGLDALSPLKVLARGYAAVKKNGSLVRSVKEVQRDDRIEIIMGDGSLDCAVCARREKDNG